MLDAGFVRSLVTRRDVDAYLCGPQPFMDTIERGLVDGGVDRARIRIERFVAANDAPKAPVNVAPSACTSIGVTLRGKRAEVPYDGKKTILRAAIDAGLDAPYSCEEGFCGCCVAQLTEGEVTMDADDALTDEDKRRRLILTCQARPRTARCAVEYPEGI
jgi:3-ketosteroid 9alpha-monooxygenase subunit B